MSLLVTAFFDAETHSYSYVLVDSETRCCAIIDPVLNYDTGSGRCSTRSADEIVAFVKANDLIVEWLLESHVHADHLSAARYLKSRFVCAQIGIGGGVRTVHQLLGDGLVEPETVFDRLFEDGERLHIGRSSGRVLALPGHTPACVGYVFEQLVCVGDTIFMPDFGTGRCDFPGGDVRQLHRSIQKLYSMPDCTRLLVGHDYGPNGRAPNYLTSVGEQRAQNIHVNDSIGETQFVKFRTERDAQLAVPALMMVAVPFNLVAGTALIPWAAAA